MQTVTSTEIQNKFGEYLEMARTEAIEVTRSGRPAAVMISPEDYKMYQALEDAYWIKRAREAENDFDVGEEEVMARLKKRTDETGE